MNPLPEQSFAPAPPARRLQVTLIAVICVLAAFDALAVLQMSRTEGSQRWLLVLAVVPAWLIVLGIWAGARIKAYSLVDGDFVVRRQWRSPRFSLEGLRKVEYLSQPLTGVRKIWGNDGLGAISGTFSCKEWGRFKMFVSDPAHAVVLEWSSGERILVSPDQLQPFVEALRRRLR